MPAVKLTTEKDLAELEARRDLDLLMRQRPVGLASVPAPVPLHRMGAGSIR
jgi:hypothetical protein